MTIDITYKCGGCCAEAEVRGVRQTTTQVSALMALISTPTLRTSAPKGWVAFDPYTGCTYCPDCWTEIEKPTAPAPSSTILRNGHGHDGAGERDPAPGDP